MKRISLIVTALAVLFLWSGCFDKKASCSDTQAKDMVHNIVSEKVAEDVGLYLLLEETKKEKSQKGKDVDNPFVENMMLIVLRPLYQTQKDQKGTKAHEAYERAKKHVANLKFSLDNIVTTSQSNTGKQASCKATANFGDGKKVVASYDLEYQVSVTDDNKKILVEVNSMKDVTK